MDTILNATRDYVEDALRQYARVEDLLTVSSRSCENTARIEYIENQTATVVGTIGYIDQAVTVSSCIDDRIRCVEEDVDKIKELLLDIQMTLRMLELDDMSKRAGDLDMLLL